MTRVLAAETLLSTYTSGSADSPCAENWRRPAAFARNSTVTFAPVFGGIGPTVHTIVWLLKTQAPYDAVAFTKLMPSGTSAVSETPCAVPGPVCVITSE